MSELQTKTINYLKTVMSGDGGAGLLLDWLVADLREETHLTNSYIQDSEYVELEEKFTALTAEAERLSNCLTVATFEKESVKKSLAEVIADRDAIQADRDKILRDAKNGISPEMRHAANVMSETLGYPSKTDEESEGEVFGDEFCSVVGCTGIAVRESEDDLLPLCAEHLERRRAGLPVIDPPSSMVATETTKPSDKMAAMRAAKAAKAANDTPFSEVKILEAIAAGKTTAKDMQPVVGICLSNVSLHLKRMVSEGKIVMVSERDMKTHSPAIYGMPPDKIDAIITHEVKQQTRSNGSRNGQPVGRMPFPVGTVPQNFVALSPGEQCGCLMMMIDDPDKVGSEFAISESEQSDVRAAYHHIFDCLATFTHQITRDAFWANVRTQLKRQAVTASAG